MVAIVRHPALVVAPVPVATAQDRVAAEDKPKVADALVAAAAAALVKVALSQVPGHKALSVKAADGVPRLR